MKTLKRKINMEPLMNQSLHICGCCKRELPHEAFYTNKRTALRMLLILHARQVVAESISRKQEKEKLNTLWEE